MFKKINRRLSLILAIILIFSSTVPTMAEDSTISDDTANYSETIDINSEESDDGIISETDDSQGQPEEIGSEEIEPEQNESDNPIDEDNGLEDLEGPEEIKDPEELVQPEQTSDIVIQAEELVYFIGDESEVDFMAGITAADAEGTDISDKLEVADYGGFEKETVGTYQIQYVIRSEEEVLASYMRDARVAMAEVTIHAKDVTIYASDYAVSDEICEDCGEMHGMPDAETAYMEAIMFDVYGWDADNRGIGNITVVDDGGFTLDRVEGEYEPSFTVKYAALDNDGNIIAMATRTITVYQFKIATRAATGYDLGGYDEEGSLRVNVLANGAIAPEGLQVYSNGSWSTDKNYCTAQIVKWFTGDQGWYGRNWSGTYNGVASTALGDGTKTYRTSGNTEYIDVAWSKAWGNGTIDILYTVSYTRGESVFYHRWQITNNTGASIPDVWLFYGGHHMLGGGRLLGWSSYNEKTGEIYCWGTNNTGFYIFGNTGAHLPSSYYAGPTSASEINANPVSKTKWSNTAAGPDDANQFHNCAFMQWDTGTLANGESWTVSAKEGILADNALLISAPNGKTVSGKTAVTISYEFTVMNMTPNNTDVNLSVTSSSGWPVRITSPTSINLTSVGTAGAESVVVVELDVPAGLANGTQDSLTLTAAAVGVTESSATRTTTTVDYNVPFISTVTPTVSQDQKSLNVKVDYDNLSAGNHSTTIQIYTASGQNTGITATQSIPTGGSVSNINISSLAPGEYQLRVTVVGIEYPHTGARFVIHDNATVSFNSNGGSAVASQTLSPGSLVVKPANPTRTGYVFGGWYKEAALLNEWNFTSDTTSSTDITLYAKWTGNAHTVTYKANGGTGSDISVPVVYGNSYSILASGTSITAPNTWSRLKEWNTSANGNGTAYSLGQNIAVSGNLTLYAIWEWDGTNFHVTYTANGGSGGSTGPSITPGQSDTVKSADQAAVTTPMNGYVFKNWNTAANGTGVSYAAGSKIVLESNITLYAQWEHDGKTWYSVTYSANGGSGGLSASSLLPGSSYSILSDTAASVSRAGYTFNGWNTSADGSGTGYMVGSNITLTRSLTLYAQWTASTSGDTVNVTYDANGGAGSTTVVVTVGASHTIQSASAAGVTKFAYRLKNWNTAADGSGTAYTVGTRLKPTTDVILYAQWVYDGSTTATVTYDANKGVGGKSVSVTPDTDHTVLSNADAGVTRLGHAFLGWSTTTGAATGAAAGVEYPVGSTLRVTGNVTLYAVWEYDGTTTVSVIYNANGGTGVTNVSGIIPGENHTVYTAAQANVVKQNCVLLGWSTDASGNPDHLAGSTLKVDNTITLYAIWEYDNTMTADVTYYINDGDVITHVDSSITLGTKYTVLSISGTSFTAIPGLIFTSWNTKEDGSGITYAPGTEITIAEDITLYAQWQHDGVTWYTVYYRGNGGTGSHTVASLKPGKYTILTGNQAGISRTNYQISGWNTLANGSGSPYAEGDTIALRGNMTLYAQWVIDGNTSVDVIYNANGGTGGKTVSAAAGSNYTILDALNADVTKTGHILQAWNTQANGNGTSYAIGSSIQPNSNVTLYAQWAHDGSTYVDVTYDANKGTGGMAIQVIPGNSHTVLRAVDVNAARLGHTFKGWSTTATGSVTHAAGANITTSSNITLYAVWEYDGSTTVKVAYDANRGTGSMEVTGIIPGNNHTVLSASGAGIARLGHVFQSWNTQADGSGINYLPGAPLKVDDTVTLYAIWSYGGSTTVSVIYNANGGTGGISVPGIVPGDDHIVLGALSTSVAKTGYKLLGWSTSASGTAEYLENAALKVDNTITLYAVWVLDNTVTANITYDANDGGGGSFTVADAYGNSHTVLFIGAVGIVYLDGLEFIGWNTEADGSGTSYTAGGSMTVTGDTTLYAQWVHDGFTWYKVIYHANGGTGSYTSADKMPGSSHTVLSAMLAGISRTGFNFTGWNTSADGTGISYVAGDKIRMTGNVNLYAQYSGGTSYKVTYVSNDSRAISFEDTASGGSYVAADQVKTGITSAITGLSFNGWNTAKDGSGTQVAPGAFLTVNANMTLYAQWKHDGSTWGAVYYRANGGKGTYNATNLTPGSTYSIQAPSAVGITRTGKTFVSWNTETNGTGTSYAPNETILIDGKGITLYAIWQ